MSIRVNDSTNQRKLVSEISSQTGYQYLKKGNKSHIIRVKTFFDGENHSIQNIFQKEWSTGEIFTCDLCYEYVRLVRNKIRIVEVNRTIVYFQSDELHLPVLTLVPKKTQQSLLFKLLGEDNPIIFDCHQKFSSKYYLSSIESAPIQAYSFFNKKLLDYFSLTPGFIIDMRSDEFVLYIDNELIPLEKIERFIRQIEDIFKRLCEASKLMLQTEGSDIKLSEGFRRFEAKLTKASNGVLGTSQVTFTDVKNFLLQPLPRKIPNKILLYRDQIAGRMWVYGGLLFSIIAFCMWVVLIQGVVFSTTRVIIENIIGLLLTTIAFSAGGFPMFYFSVRTRFRISRLLRSGILTMGVIENIERSNITVDGRALYALTVKFVFNGSQIKSTCLIPYRSTKKAYKLQKERKTVHLLYDPKNPDLIFWPAVLVNASFL